MYTRSLFFRIFQWFSIVIHLKISEYKKLVWFVFNFMGWSQPVVQRLFPVALRMHVVPEIKPRPPLCTAWAQHTELSPWPQETDFNCQFADPCQSAEISCWCKKSYYILKTVCLNQLVVLLKIFWQLCNTAKIHIVRYILILYRYVDK